MLTGQQEKQVLEDCREAGAIDYIVNPFDGRTLHSKITGYLDGDDDR